MPLYSTRSNSTRLNIDVSLFFPLSHFALRADADTHILATMAREEGQRKRRKGYRTKTHSDAWNSTEFRFGTTKNPCACTSTTTTRMRCKYDTNNVVFVIYLHPLETETAYWIEEDGIKSLIFCSFVRSTRHHMLLTCDSLCTCCSKHSLFRFFYQTNNDNNNHSGSSKKSEAWLLIESECVARERKRRERAWAREQSSRTTTSTCRSCLMWIVLSLHKLMCTRILAL